ncbi:mutS protein homolog 5-like [Euwallacea similis]|uniref:mutS protein homolog 5-like n=1 Tax=Euwallacea similis TaxID=1736056 RepID=UPI0034502159
MDYSNSQEVLNLRQNTTNTDDTASISLRQEDDGSNNGVVLCLLHKNGMLGAAYYSFIEKTLNLYEEMSDIGPQFSKTLIIQREISPKYLVILGDITEEYIQFLIDLSNSDTSNTTTSSRSLPSNFFLLSLREYTYEACKTIVSNINVASNISDESDHKHELFLRSFVNLNYRLSVQALGALSKFLEKHWSTFGVDTAAEHFMHIHPVTLKNRVFLDNQAFKTLQIFSLKSHDAGFKRGQESSCREGLSVYRLFLSGCKSGMGQSQLRTLLLSPINDYNELQKRLNFIKFVQEPANMDFIANIQDNIKEFKDIGYISLILSKIQNARASSKDWSNLHKIIYHTLFINDISRTYKRKTDLLEELNYAITHEVICLQESINNALDFKAGAKRGRPVIKFGLDERLDAKLLLQQDLAKHLTAAARMTVNNLPNYISECKVVFLPEMGHLIAIKEWGVDCDPEDLQRFDYKFMFTLGGVIHYKNPLCVELDRRLGGINAEIIDHENRILRRLSEFALKYNKDIRNAVKVVAKIDCLIAMAKVCQQNNYVKPDLSSNRTHEIIQSRHPLMEQIFASFEPNDFFSGSSHSFMKIITGPNGSGKSVFLAQVLITIYLAHIGCYVPAKQAKIGLVESIHLVMHCSESVVVKLSSFMINITQSAQALHFWSPSSIIIMDEFGRGTLDDDGVILLAGILKYFLEKKDACPHVIVSTHLQQIASILPESRYLEYLKMDQTIENGTFCFLYKMSKGVSKSFASQILEACPESQDLVNRAKCYLNYIRNLVPMELPKESREIEENYLGRGLNISPVEEKDVED